MRGLVSNTRKAEREFSVFQPLITRAECLVPRGTPSGDAGGGPAPGRCAAMYELSNIDIDIVERDGVVVVALQGEVDLCAAPELEASLTRAGAGHTKPIVVDLDRVSFMDSAGVHVLLQFSLAKGNGNRLALTRGSRQVQRLFQVTGVERYLPFVTEPQAPRSASG
jgi:anti-sigma B factor antagonist